ncbi:tryptophan 7-halogenase [Neptunicella sp. SCSIO 80796]|uniref:tryptophan 7-halogenase n=1 Tax=Neptunicella plasticusilytica TaxID=3117012 RepID=UPI003A4D67A8
MNPLSIRHIVLVGHSLPLHLSAAILACRLAGYGVKITALEIAGNSSGDVECTCGQFMGLCDILNVPLKTMLKTCQATFSLGQRYQQDQNNWFVPYGHFGLKKQDSEFIQGIFRLQQQRPELQIDSACIAAQAAQQGKFAIPPANRPDLQAALAFAVHLNAGLYAQQLKQTALQHGVSFIEVDSIDLNRENGQQIHSVAIKDNKVITADFWIDCSGSLSLLATDSRQVKLAQKINPCDKLTECYIDSPTSPQVPYSTFEACPWGWLKVIPAPGRVFYQLEYTSQRVSSRSIETWLVEALPSRPQHIQHRDNIPLIVPQAWTANCLAVGDAAVNLGKTFYSELFFVQAALLQFLDLYPGLSGQDICAHKFNRNWQRFVDETAEYAQFHYWLWGRENLDNPLPDDVLFTRRVALFLRFGRLLPADTDAVDEQRWYGILAALHQVPQLASLYLSNLSDDQLEQSFAQIGRTIDRLVTGMPSYQDFYHQFSRT